MYAEHAAVGAWQQRGAAGDGVEYAPVADPLLPLHRLHAFLRGVGAGVEVFLLAERVGLQVHQLVAEGQPAALVNPFVCEPVLQRHAARGVVARQHGYGERVGAALAEEVCLHPPYHLGHVTLAARLAVQEITYPVVEPFASGGRRRVRRHLEHPCHPLRVGFLGYGEHQPVSHAAAYLPLGLAGVCHWPEACAERSLRVGHQAVDVVHVAFAGSPDYESLRCQFCLLCHVVGCFCRKITVWLCRNAAQPT